MLGLLPVLSGVIAGIAGVSLGFGFVHGITLGFGVTLIGEAVDYAIYLFTQTAPGAAPAATLPRIWPTLRLGMLTSVCGFSAMLLSSFIGFAQLGLFTIVGLVVALAVTRFVLPALLRRSFTTVASLVFAAPLLALIRVGRTLVSLVLGLAIAAVAGARLPSWPLLGRRIVEHEPGACGGKIAGRAIAPRNGCAGRALFPGRAGADDRGRA